ncbi:MAG: HtrA protease/chaperone protein [uncultured Sulfurovum sp.]|uniref:HtrA protease/chaperone protein n=1 Tax=uncultured Sulfurovum sp. TaxID=269237 RepID=A0A6S6SKG0_9BACT|nr:MAG: HtrA protease/chaperone protein [uncultured Sulfurovum sp.]
MENTKNSIYKVVTSTGTGTGFKIEGKDFLITNYHVVEGSKVVAVENHKQDKFKAQVVMVNPEVDLAFLQVDALRDAKGEIRLEKEVEVKNLHKVYINGFPFGLPFTVTEGVVSAFDQPMGQRKYIQTDAAVNSGNSGGPMLNSEGVLVGITTSKFKDADNVGFGIKHTDLIKEVEDFHFSDGKYRLKCNSCDEFIDKASKFCASCGKSIDSSVFDEFEKSYITKIIDETLTQNGFDTVLCTTGHEYWSFHKGTALVRIFTSGDDFLFATSPLNELPKKNLQALLGYLVSGKESPYILGVTNDKIYVSYRVHLSDFYGEEKEIVQKNFGLFPQKAEELSNFFHTEFACEKSMESKRE